jgi:protein-tyrosine phosphatase
MIDLHTHVLPGVDDGPPDTVGSVAMADLAARCGTNTLVATPHVREDHPRVVVEEIRERAGVLNRMIRDYGIDIFIVPGAELSLSSAVELSDDELDMITLAGNGRDLLVETPHGPLPSVFEELVGGLVGRGFRVTLAHPELNPTFQQDPERLGSMVEAGTVFLQITSASFERKKRSPTRTLALELFERGWAHVIASDAHSAEWRPPDLRPGLEAALRAVPGAERELDWMVTVAPLAIVQGLELPPRPPRAAARSRGLWERVRGG